MKERTMAKAFILEAIDLEKAGKKVEKGIQTEIIVEELMEAFGQNSLLKTAFYQLTPGRQRAYLLHFAQPKQAKTRTARIEQCAPLILRGDGLHDAYRK